MTKVEYKNRYQDIFTFTLDEDGNILWEGNFKWCRFGWPNVYTEAYDKYVEDGGKLSLEEFKEEVHGSSFTEDNKYIGPNELATKYGELVYSDTNIIDMVDPSGGPYLHSRHDMGDFSKDFSGMIVDRFEPIETGYKIIIKK